MNLLKTITLVILIVPGLYTQAQNLNSNSELEQIEEVLMHYIDGTANGEPERLKKAFHPDLNLYSVQGDSISVLSGSRYISYFENRKKRNRIGRIISIDYENDAASAKIEVIMPARKRIYTDYLLLLKVDMEWKIIHKSYTYRTNPIAE